MINRLPRPRCRPGSRRRCAGQALGVRELRRSRSGRVDGERLRHCQREQSRRVRLRRRSQVGRICPLQVHPGHSLTVKTKTKNRWFGTADGQDGYDTIEHLATLPWCSGKIATVGNSWLAIAQWHIAALNPPHLTCFAPLEGSSDPYREMICRGGVPCLPFVGFIKEHALFGTSRSLSIMIVAEAHWQQETTSRKT